MEENKLIQKLKSHDLVFATTSFALGWTGILQVLKNDVLDFLIFDLEHGHFTYETCEQMLRTCNYLEIPAIVRVEDCEYHAISKYLDMGADGIMIPRVETAEQAMSAIKYIRFPPLGKKGCGGFSLLHDGSGPEEFNRQRVIFLQIESPLGAENLAKILEKGAGEFAGIIVGPRDLSISMGIPFCYDDIRFIQQVENIFGTAKSAGVPYGIFCEDDKQIQFWRSRGAQIIWSGVDIDLFSRGYQDLCHTVREIKSRQPQ